MKTKISFIILIILLSLSLAVNVMAGESYWVSLKPGDRLDFYCEVGKPDIRVMNQEGTYYVVQCTTWGIPTK